MRGAGLPIPNGLKTINYTNGTTDNIIEAIHTNFTPAAKQTEKFYKRFKGINRLESARKIWDFLRNEMIYVKDSDGEQNIKLPARFVGDTGKSDCKSFSLFAASILKNLNMPVGFRYASYTGSPIPTHVYVFTSDENGKEIIIDGVYNKFNKEVPYTHKKNYVMNISTLSGVPYQARLSNWRRAQLSYLQRAFNNHKPGLYRVLLVEKMNELQGIPFTPIVLTPDQRVIAARILARLQARRPRFIMNWYIRRKLGQTGATVPMVSNKFNMIRGVNGGEYKAANLAELQRILTVNREPVYRMLITEKINELQGIPFTPIVLTPEQRVIAARILARLQANKPGFIMNWYIRRKLGQTGTAAGDVAGIGRRKKRERFKGKLIHLANLPALAPARAAVLSLIAINYRGLAGKFAYGLTKRNKKFKQMWYTMGGNPAKLVGAVNRGKRKKPFLGGKKTSAEMKSANLSGLRAINENILNGIYDEPVNIGVNGFGVAPAIPALLAAAATLIGVLSKMFKDKPKEPGEGSTAEILAPTGVTAEGLKESVTSILNPPNAFTAGVSSNEGVSESRGNSPEAQIEKAEAAVKAEEAEKTSFKPSPMLIGGAVLAAGALYFLTKKK